MAWAARRRPPGPPLALSPAACRAQATDFLITGSVDGHLKFWKKKPEGVEFVKHFRAHKSAIDGALFRV